jgi:hypothetical protein
MNRVPTAAQLRTHSGCPRRDAVPASDPAVDSLGTQPAPFGPGDAGILVALTASVSAGVVIWGLALGYLRF